MRILLVEDDPTLGDALCFALKLSNYAVDRVANGNAADQALRDGCFDLLILDLGLPKLDGFEVLKRLRHRNATLPVLILSGRDDPEEKVRGLDLGADDYVQKPFSYDELRSRIEAVLRRRHSRLDGPVRVGEIVVDPSRRKVTVGDREVHLAKKEFTLMRVLVSDPTRVFSKDELLRDVWGLRSPAGSTRTLDSHASRLRRKLDPENQKYVVNCWGVGYRLVDDRRGE